MCLQQWTSWWKNSPFPSESLFSSPGPTKDPLMLRKKGGEVHIFFCLLDFLYYTGSPLKFRNANDNVLLWRPARLVHQSFPVCSLNDGTFTFYLKPLCCRVTTCRLRCCRARSEGGGGRPRVAGLWAGWWRTIKQCPKSIIKSGGEIKTECFLTEWVAFGNICPELLD